AMANRDRISILTVDDDEDYRGLLARRFARRGHDVEQTGSPREALRRAEEKHFDVVILDVAMPELDGVQLLEKLRQIDPETQVILLTGQATIETAIRAMKLGAYDFLTKPCPLAEVEMQTERAYDKARLARENQALRTMLRRSEPSCEIIGQSAAIRDVVHLIHRVAPTESSILIQGESGTGKELVARAVHEGSPRADKPLVVINCAALQESLLESELFGHEKGAFTSAVATKPGLFELAHGGTLFIDEIGEMTPAIQAKLLRATEGGRIRRVGSTREIVTDVRIIAATNKNLAEEVAAHRFRDDLYYRLNVITITSPPLRARTGDVPLLVRHFLQRGTSVPRDVDTAAMELLERYDWPGNVRELANVIERAKILADGPIITTRDLPAEIRRSRTSPPSPPETPETPSTALNLHEGSHVRRVLEAEGGNKARAARALQISRRKLYRLLEKHAIDAPGHTPGSERERGPS
ncbi:MAG: sigma-54-dependent transcriptional regulator, partial [Isosphaeraceae bacterium]